MAFILFGRDYDSTKPKPRCKALSYSGTVKESSTG